MAIEQRETEAFFGRPVQIVAREFAVGLYDHKTKLVTPTGNPGKTVVVSTPEGDKEYRVTIVEPYLEVNATLIWQGKRAQEIRDLSAGETITYNSRSGKLTFIKTTGADNIWICGLEEVGTGEAKAKTTPSEVTKTLGLVSRDIGRLTLIEGDRFRFVRT